MQAVQIRKLDHVNVHTTNVERMVEWYDRVLGMPAGARPPFPFPGAWLYCGDQAVVHLVGVDTLPKSEGMLQLEHFAFNAVGLKEFVARLEREKVPYDGRLVQGGGGVQINVYDPDGNHIHVDFYGAETEGVEFRSVDASAMNQR
ncbi:MAG TPA: VOC family protein [Hyphomicrobiaceae bacterium]|jgi:catechol 2,3-dioxygenase-like lactoylglutathione lyase family enzyme|nr:VOC family protein [Hyphomicrobiaceae bacterium]